MQNEQTKKRGRQSGFTEDTLKDMQRIIDYIRDATKEPPHIPPTLGQIALGIGRKEADAGNIQPLVKALIKEGFLEKHGRFRSVTVATKPPRKYFYKP